jgi:hypothetical protein
MTSDIRLIQPSNILPKEHFRVSAGSDLLKSAMPISSRTVPIQPKEGEINWTNSVFRSVNLSISPALISLRRRRADRTRPNTQLGCAQSWGQPVFSF